MADEKKNETTETTEAPKGPTRDTRTVQQVVDAAAADVERKRAAGAIPKAKK